MFGTARATAIAFGLLALFFGFCAYYATQISLWGDEAFSLQLAARSWSEMLAVPETHLRTYYLLLKEANAAIAPGCERIFLLRLFHALLFAGGLAFGCTLASRLAKPTVVLGALGLAVVLPPFIYYATNIRMYALLFLTAMGYFAAVARVLDRRQLTRSTAIALELSAIALLASTYLATYFYLVGVPFWARYCPGRWQRLGLVLLPLATLAFAAPSLATDVSAFLNWPVAASQSLDERTLLSWVKLTYLSARPLFDFIYPAGLPVWLALAAPVAIALAIFAGTVSFARRSELRWLVLAIAWCWLPFVPVGLSFARTFLPSMFAMLVVLAVSVAESPPTPRRLGMGLLALLLALNLHQALFPTLRLYNLIPYRQIAADAADAARDRHLDRIYLGTHTLNNRSVQYYLDRFAPDLDLVWLDPGFDPARIASDRFLFIAHLPESGQYVDPARFEPDFTLDPLHAYIDLDTLPYNRLWQQRLRDRVASTDGWQTHAARIFFVARQPAPTAPATAPSSP